MGYGAERGDFEHRGGPGDRGIDGLIRQDPLGLDRVYVQAKRYAEQSVGSQEIQAFVGALHGEQADRGVFITTSRVTANALDYVKRIPNRIILIDGQRRAHGAARCRRPGRADNRAQGHPRGLLRMTTLGETQPFAPSTPPIQDWGSSTAEFRRGDQRR
ncbi:MAG: restriction endonuclease [Micromonosporaceae bacterium]